VETGYRPNVGWIHFDSVHPADTVRHGDAEFAEQSKHRHNIDVTSWHSFTNSSSHIHTMKHRYFASITPYNPTFNIHLIANKKTLVV